MTNNAHDAIRAAIAAGLTCSVPYHVEGYGPGRTCLSWGAPQIGEALGPEGWLRIEISPSGGIVLADDDECPEALWGADASGPGMLVVRD